MNRLLDRITAGAPLAPLAVLFGLNTVDELDRVAFGVLLPEIREAFGLSITATSAVVAAGIPVLILVGLPVAYAADRWNRTRISAAGALLWAGFSVLTGLAPALAVLVVARLGASLGRSFNAAHESLLADYYPTEARGHVFFVHRLANPVGLSLAALVAGAMAHVWSWRAPFVVLAAPSVVLAVLALRLHEPARGRHELRAAGADDATADVDDEPAGVEETFRVVYAMRSTRRLATAIVFFGAGTFGIGSFYALLFEEEFGLNAAQRGLLFAFAPAFIVAGLVIGARLVQKRIDRDPGSVMPFIAGAAVASGCAVAVVALSPNLAVAWAALYVDAFFFAVIGPGFVSVLSLAIPPRMRTFGFATYGLWNLLGLGVLPFVGTIADAHGLRVGLLSFLPLYITGALIAATAGRSMNADIAQVRHTALVRAEVRRRRLEGDAMLLVVRDLDVSYDGTQVLFGVNFEVADGELVALLGTNGAGKSTLLRTVSGVVIPDEGSIVFDGRDVRGSEPFRTAARGISHIPGGRSIFPGLTVAENIRTAGWLRTDDDAELEADVKGVLDLFPALRERWDTPAGVLSGGEQQMLGLAQALISRPKLLLIDELSIGLSPALVSRLLDVVREINARGTTVVLVEQSVTTALRLADRAVFMEKGEVRFDGPADELLARPDLLRAVFLSASRGSSRRRTLSPAERKRRSALLQGPVVMRATSVSKRFGGVEAVGDVDLSLHEGEILGMIGPNGAGKTTLFDVLSGVLRPDGGRVWIGDTEVTSWPAHERARLGLGRSFQDAKLWPSLTVRESFAVACERYVTEPGPLEAMLGLGTVTESEQAIDDRVDALIELLGLRAFGDKFVSELSTGSRRLVDLGVLLAGEPKILLLDEPSAGIAQREAEALAPVLRAVQRHTGCAMLLIEHDMPLIRDVADHLLALDGGRVIASGLPHEVLSDSRVVEAYLGEGPSPSGRGRPRRRASARPPPVRSL